MVTREGRFARCRVVAVEEELPGLCFVVRFSAEQAAWFDPDAAGAGPDGWLRDITEVEGELRMLCATPDAHAASLARARRWREDGTLLTGFADLERQAVGLFIRASRSPEDYLVCRMNPEEMDRP